jgi:fermentation-respiration switch protein FrsA (DUF1100 family)
MVAARDPSLAFIVMMAGFGVPGREVYLEQCRQRALSIGASPAEADRGCAFRRRVIDAVADARDEADAEARLRALRRPNGEPSGLSEEEIRDESRPRRRLLLTYDPSPTLRQVRVPVLALIGSLDRQVSAAQNLPPIRAALAQNKDATVIEMPGLNHFFQHAKTGAPEESGFIEETLAPELLQTVSDWIAKHVK